MLTHQNCMLWKEIRTVPVWNRVLDVQFNALSYPAQVRITMYMRVYAHTHRAAHTHYNKTSLRIHGINSIHPLAVICTQALTAQHLRTLHNSAIHQDIPILLHML